MKNDIGWKIKRLADEMNRNANSKLQQHNLTFTQIRVMVHLLRHADNNTSTLKKLEKQFEVAQATMAGIASRLEAKNLVEGFVLPEDRRVKCIRLTDKGRALLNEEKERLDAYERRLKAGFSELELETLNTYLDRIYNNINDTPDTERN
ncbi:MAG: winged helix DNA-binding protein [Solobacterium sp.]|nr:winged helix DNA-binding protein [Solobacterium sp.]